MLLLLLMVKEANNVDNMNVVLETLGGNHNKGETELLSRGLCSLSAFLV